MRLEDQFDEMFRQPEDAPTTSRRKNFGAKPNLWDTWVKLDDEERDSVNELANIKVCCTLRSPPFKMLIFVVVPLATRCYVRSPRDRQAYGLVFLILSASV